MGVTAVCITYAMSHGNDGAVDKVFVDYLLDFRVRHEVHAGG